MECAEGGYPPHQWRDEKTGTAGLGEPHTRVPDWCAPTTGVGLAGAVVDPNGR